MWKLASTLVIQMNQIHGDLRVLHKLSDLIPSNLTPFNQWEQLRSIQCKERHFPWLIAKQWNAWFQIKYAQLRGSYNGSVVKNLPSNVGDTKSIPGLGRSLREGNGNPLQCSCLGIPIEPGMLQSMGSQRVRHELVTKQQQQHLLLDKSAMSKYETLYMCYTVLTFQSNITRACRSIRNMTGKELNCF